MTRTPSGAADAAHAWQQPIPETQRTRVGLYAWRAFIALCFLLAIVLFGYLLFLWLSPARTHLIVLKASGLSLLGGPPVAVAGTEIGLLEPLDEVATYEGPEPIAAMDSPQALRSWSSKLDALELQPQDSLIIYLAAHGISYDGKAYLVCNNFDPATPTDGLFPIHELLSSLGRVPANIKMLILDSGQINYDPALGLIVNDFTSLLQQDVHSTNDRNLWVLCSNSDRQRSRKVPALGASVFGTFVAGGLRGAADSDRDGFITVGEFSEFVRAKVAAATQDIATGPQLPILLSLGAEPSEQTIARSVPLLSAREVNRTRSIDDEDIDRLIRGVVARSSFVRGMDMKLAGVDRGFLAHLSAPEGPTGPPTAIENLTDRASDPNAAAGAGNAAETGASSADASQATPDAAQAAALRQLRLLLEHAWQVRDRLAEPAGETAAFEWRPVDATPHLWRESQAELVAHEQVLAGSDPNASASAQSLQAALAKFWTLQDEKPVLVRDFLRIAGSAEDAVPLPIDAGQLKSLAIGRLVGQQFSPEASAAFEQPVAVLDGLIDANPDELAKTISELPSPSGFEQLYELRLVTQLGAVAGIDPSLAQLALQTRRDGERVAANSIRYVAWVDAEFEAADRARLAAERQMLDQIGSGWQARARDLLQRAADGYASASEVQEAVQRADRLRSDLAFRAPYYVRLRAQELAAAKQGTDDDTKLDAFLDQLSNLYAMLDQPHGKSLRRLNEIGTQLRQLDNELAEQFSESRDDAWQISRLLETPVPSASSRQQLFQGTYLDQGSAEIQARELVEAFVPVEKGAASTLAAAEFPASLVQQFGWEVKLARLAVGTDSAAPDKASRALQRAEAELKHLTALLTAASPPTPEGRKKADEEKRSAIYRFGRAFQDLYAALPDRIKAAMMDQAALSRQEAHRQIVRARRALQFMDPRDAGRFRNVDLAAISRNLHLHDLLLWHATRFQRAQADAPRAEIEYLSSAAEDHLGEAQKLFPSISIAAGPLVEIGAPETISLVHRSRHAVEIPVHYRGVGTSDAWVILQYDRDLVEVTGSASVYHEHALPATIQASLESSGDDGRDQISEADRQLAVAYPYRPDLAGVAPTWQAMRRGEPRSLGLELRSRGNDRDTTQVIVKVICRPISGAADTGSSSLAANDIEYDHNVSYVRQSIEVPLRVVEIALDAQPGTWQQQGEKLILHTFPNRVTSYAFGIVNRGPSDREITLTFFAPETSLDLAALSDAEVTNAVSRLKPSGQLTIAAAADGEPHFATAAEAKAPEAAAAAAEAAPEPAPAPEEAASAPPAGPSVRNGMLVEVSDANDLRQTYVQQIEIVPQRPRRYVTPKVSYNSRLERIEVMVTPRLGLVSLLPPGQVTVECQIADDLATQTEGKLRDVIRAPEYEARLFAYVPASPPRLVTLHLHVDGYPRAFVYRVPCGAHAIDVPEQKKLAALRLRKTAWPDYQPPAAVTPVETQVDSSVGTFESGSDTVQVSLDENMDNLMGPEQGPQLATDRQAEAFLQALGDDGLLAVDTRVADHQVALFTDRLQNVRVLVHGQLSAGGRHEDSSPISLNIDGSPPRVNYVEVSPWGGFVAAGTELQVAVNASDQMSGVQAVEVGFDVEGTGKFSDKAPPVVAVPDPARYSIDVAANSLTAAPSTRSDAALAGSARPEHWIAKLPTEGVLGIQTLLVRAVDHVGNASEFYGKRVQILTPEQAAAKVQQQAKLIEGTVIFRNQPVPGATVKLLDAEAKELAASPAGTDGRFSLAGIPPGEYAVRAEGVVNNVTRFGTQDIVVEVTPIPVLRADVRLE